MDLESIKSYLKIDDDSDDLFLQDLIEISDIYIESMVSNNYKTDVKLVKLAELLQKKLISDMFQERGTQIPSSTKSDRITESILMKLSIANGVV